VLEPEGHTDGPSTDHFRLDAEGKAMRLSDNEMTVNCRSFVYQSPEQAGRLTGSPGRPVVMTLADGSQQVSCRAVRFNRAEQLAELVGPGFMSTGPQASPPSATAPASQPATRPAGRRRIAWRDSVTARIGALQAEGGKSGSRPFISEAIFRGGVELRDDEAASFVRGDTLHIWLAEGEQGPYPTRAKVAGNVTARQNDSDVAADEIVVHFAELPAAARQPGRTGFHETMLTARGNVKIIDRSRDRPVVATADVINVMLDDPDSRHAELLGAPARISQDAHSLTGNKIELHEATRSAAVRGAGSVTFVSDRDPQGRKLDKPRPVRISWSDGMDYDGDRNEAIFKGNVKLASGLSRIECREMTATFEEIAGGTAESPPADEGAAGVVSFNPDSFGRGELTKVVAEGEVLVVYETVSQDDKLLQAMQLRSDNLTYNARTDRIDCTGYGLLVIEDYRPPDQAGNKPASTAEPLSRVIQRPWQTVFEWHKMMRLMLDSRVVIMDGGVVMIHHSGSNIPSAKDMRIPDWSGVTTGRTSTLGCGRLMAQFPQPDKQPDGSAGGQKLSPVFDPGSEVGDLQMFVATRDVVLEDRDYELRGAQLSYLREKGFAILWGYMDDQPVADAYVYSRGQPVSSPKFLCYLEKGHVKKVVAMDVTGSGAR